MGDRPTVYFHIGGHKTGTTFLQSVLWANRAALRRDGVLYPGKSRASHVWASRDLRSDPGTAQRAHTAGAWARLVGEIREWGGPAIIDQERFSLTDPASVTKAMADLDFADVQVVFTARDMARTLPSAWQEWIKNGDTIAFGAFLLAVRNRTDEARRFMGLHDVPAILGRWAAVAGPDHVQLITVPPPGSEPTLLWHRFAGVACIDPNRYDLRTAGANSSLGAAQAAVLRKLNQELAGADAGLSKRDYNRLVKFGLAPVLAGHRGPPVALPRDAYDWAVDWANGAVRGLVVAGYRVTGDLAELVPASPPSGQDPDDVDPADLLAAAIAAMRILLQPASGEPAAAGEPQ